MNEEIALLAKKTPSIFYKPVLCFWPVLLAMTDKIVVLCTCSSDDEAAKISRLLVELRLAACVNTLPGLRSTYRWQGAIVDSAEFLLLIKTRRDLFQDLKAAIQSAHSYRVPEVIALPIVDGAVSYLEWLAKETREPDEEY